MVNFDFDEAQNKLRECEPVLVNGFCLVACLEDFINNACLFIFETFCHIHQCISINTLADELNVTLEEAERWAEIWLEMQDWMPRLFLSQVTWL